MTSITRSIIRSVFWEDHEADMLNPEYAHNFVATSTRLAVLNAIADNLSRREKSEY